MTIEEARQMLEEMETIRDDFNDRMHLWALKWQGRLMNEELERDRWAEKESTRHWPKKGIEELANLPFNEIKRKLAS